MASQNLDTLIYRKTHSEAGTRRRMSRVKRAGIVLIAMLLVVPAAVWPSGGDPVTQFPGGGLETELDIQSPGLCATT